MIARSKVSVRVFKNAGDGFVVQLQIGCATVNVVLIPSGGGEYTWNASLTAAGASGDA